MNESKMDVEIAKAYNKWFFALLDSEIENLLTEESFEAGFKAGFRLAREFAKEDKELEQ